MSRTTATPDRDPLTLKSGAEALQSSPEFRGPVESMEGHHCNDHFALIYESRRERLEAVVPFLRQGIERGERCMYVVDELSRETILSELRDGGVDVDAALETGQLSFHTVEETYLRNGRFDPDEMVDFYARAIEELAAGYTALRVVAETTWLREGTTSVEQFLEYEAKINDLFDGEDCIALCQYDRTAFDPEVIRDVVRTHPHLIYDGTVCNNLYHTPPEQYFAPDDPGREVERMMGTLLDRAEARVALEERQRYQQELYAITSNPDRTFDEKLEALFALGCEVFDMDLGAIARVDAETDYFEIERTSHDHKYFEPGVRLELSETYCTAATDADSPAIVTDPDREGYGEIHVRREFGIESYLGTHLTFDSGDDRTFFFVSEEPRREPISEAERTFHHLMGQWVKYELERRNRERFLRELYEITADGERSFEEKIESVLELGCARFDLDQGYLTQYHPEREVVDNEHAVGPADQDLRTGVADAQPMPGQFCRATIERDEPMGTTDVRELGWDDDPVYLENGLQSYFGVRVTDGAGVYGTLAFCDTAPRERPYTDAEDTFLELMGQWVSHELQQQRRENQLTALNEMSRTLMEAETVTEIAEETVDRAHGSLRLPLTAVAAYERESGRLAPAAQTSCAADELPVDALCDGTSGPVWEAFVSNEIAVVDGDAAALSDCAVTELVVVPLARQGVLLTATTATAGFDDAERDFVETTASTVEAACTRADRERQLHEREETLEEKNAALERLDRINTTIRTLDQSLVQAATREDVEKTVCEQLTDVGPYELAWIGDRDAVTDEVVPREIGGSDAGYFDDVAADGDDDGRCPAAEAIETREPQVVNDVLSDPAFEPWRQSALNRGYHACIVLPLSYEGTLYGVLVIYAGQPDVFDELEREVLTEMADTIAYAINAVESKKALISDELTELEFGLEGTDRDIVDAVRATGCELSLETIVPQSDGKLRGFFTTRGVTAEEAMQFAPRLPVTDLTAVSESTDGDEPVNLFEATMEDECLAATVLEHGGQLTRLNISEEGATLTVTLAADARVREFVEMFRTKYPGATLTAQRTRERTQRTSQGLRSAVLEELTPRQLEVLQTAYFNGYFEEPRTRTASEIADTLDITQPTFTSHARKAQRKLFRHLFEEDPLRV